MTSLLDAHHLRKQVSIFNSLFVYNTFVQYSIKGFCDVQKNIRNCLIMEDLNLSFGSEVMGY